MLRRSKDFGFGLCETVDVQTISCFIQSAQVYGAANSNTFKYKPSAYGSIFTVQVIHLQATTEGDDTINDLKL